MKNQKVFKPKIAIFHYQEVVKTLDSFSVGNKKVLEIKMHILQPKHVKLSEKESEELLASLNVSKSQLPKILVSDPALPEGCQIGDVIKIERKDKEETVLYYRVVV